MAEVGKPVLAFVTERGSSGSRRVFLCPLRSLNQDHIWFSIQRHLLLRDEQGVPLNPIRNPEQVADTAKRFPRLPWDDLSIQAWRTMDRPNASFYLEMSIAQWIELTKDLKTLPVEQQAKYDVTQWIKRRAPLSLSAVPCFTNSAAVPGLQSQDAMDAIEAIKEGVMIVHPTGIAGMSIDSTVYGIKQRVVLNTIATVLYRLKMAQGERISLGQLIQQTPFLTHQGLEPLQNHVCGPDTCMPSWGVVECLRVVHQELHRYTDELEQLLEHHEVQLTDLNEPRPMPEPEKASLPLTTVYNNKPFVYRPFDPTQFAQVWTSERQQQEAMDIDKVKKAAEKRALEAQDQKRDDDDNEDGKEPVAKRRQAGPEMTDAPPIGNVVAPMSDVPTIVDDEAVVAPMDAEEAARRAAEKRSRDESDDELDEKHSDDKDRGAKRYQPAPPQEPVAPVDIVDDEIKVKQEPRTNESGEPIVLDAVEAPDAENNFDIVDDEAVAEAKVKQEPLTDENGEPISVNIGDDNAPEAVPVADFDIVDDEAEAEAKVKAERLDPVSLREPSDDDNPSPVQERKEPEQKIPNPFNAFGAPLPPGDAFSASNASFGQGQGVSRFDQAQSNGSPPDDNPVPRFGQVQGNGADPPDDGDDDDDDNDGDDPPPPGNGAIPPPPRAFRDFGLRAPRTNLQYQEEIARLRAENAALRRNHVEWAAGVLHGIEGVLREDEGLMLAPFNRMQNQQQAALRAITTALWTELTVNAPGSKAMVLAQKILSENHAPLIRGNVVRRTAVLDALVIQMLHDLRRRLPELMAAPHTEQFNQLVTQFNLLDEAFRNDAAYDNDVIQTQLEAVNKAIREINKPAEGDEDCARKLRELNKINDDLRRRLDEWEVAKAEEKKELTAWIEDSLAALNPVRGAQEPNIRDRFGNVVRAMQARHDAIEAKTPTFLPKLKRRTDEPPVPSSAFEVMMLQDRAIQYMYGMLNQVPTRAADLGQETLIDNATRRQFTERWREYMDRAQPMIQSMVQDVDDFKARSETIKAWIKFVGVAKEFGTADELRRNLQDYRRLKLNRDKARNAFDRLSFWCRLAHEQMARSLGFYHVVEPEPGQLYLDFLERPLAEGQLVDDDVWFGAMRNYVERLVRSRYISNAHPILRGGDDMDRVDLDDQPESIRESILFLCQFAEGEPAIINRLRVIYEAASNPTEPDAFAFVHEAFEQRIQQNLAYTLLIHIQFTRLVYDGFAPSFLSIWNMKTVALANSTNVKTITQKINGFIKTNEDKVRDLVADIQKALGRVRVWTGICTSMAAATAAAQVLAWAPSPTQFKQVLSRQTIQAMYKPARGVVLTDEQEDILEQIADIDARLYDRFTALDVPEAKYEDAAELRVERMRLCDRLGGGAALLFLRGDEYQRIALQVMQQAMIQFDSVVSQPDWQTVVMHAYSLTEEFTRAVDPTIPKTIPASTVIKALQAQDIVGASRDYLRMREYIRGLQKDRRKVKDIPVEQYLAMIHDWFQQASLKGGGGGGGMGRALGGVIVREDGDDNLQLPVVENPYGSETYKAFFLLAVLTAGEAGLTLYDVLAVNHAASRGLNLVDHAQRKLAYMSEVNKALVTLRRSNQDSKEVLEFLQRISDDNNDFDMTVLEAQADMEAHQMGDDLTNDQLTTRLMSIYTPLMLSALTMSIGYVSRTEACKPLADRSLHSIVAGSEETRRLFASLCATQLRLNLVQAGTTKLQPNVMNLLTAQMRQLQYLFVSKLEHAPNGQLRVKVM